MPEKLGYAVIDLETTGLEAYDSIIEVAVVLLDPERNITGYYDTLVKPDQPIRGTEIHGITDEMVEAAPSFYNIALTLAALLNGRKLVAHNAKFEARFLNREFGKLGIGLNVSHFADTVYLARQAIPQGSYRLNALARYYNIPLINAHAAINDALATAVLFKELVANPSIRRLTYGRGKNFVYDDDTDINTISWTSRIVDAGKAYGAISSIPQEQTS
jgi:DNA polymerase-3 subunit epsilon